MLNHYDINIIVTVGGQNITRQLSSSHVTPRNMSDYQNFFR